MVAAEAKAVAATAEVGGDNKTTTTGTLAERVASKAGAVVVEADAAAAAVGDNKQTS